MSRKLKQSGSVVQFNVVIFFSIGNASLRVISFESRPVLQVQMHYLLCILNGITGPILGRLYQALRLLAYKIMLTSWTVSIPVYFGGISCRENLEASALSGR